jgi:predicted nucleic acid-binding protein
MRHGEDVFVDTGAWIALAVIRDPYHQAAVSQWEMLLENRARLSTSVPVVIETFTFLQRNANLMVASAWRDSFGSEIPVKVLECRKQDLDEAWSHFQHRKFHKLSVVDASSFTLMRRHKIRRAFAFDHHFTLAGFKPVA